MQFSKFDTTIGGTKHQVLVIDPTSVEMMSKPAPKTHHILVLDRSYSMAYELDKLMNQVNKTIDVLGSKDLLSIFYFSGPGNCRAVVLGAKPSDDIKQLVDSMRTPLDTTCFSEVFGDISSRIGDYTNIVDQTVIHLFTDGRPVVPWNNEEYRVMQIVDKMLQSGVSTVNTIGYGRSYNEEFLRGIADSTNFGTFTHATQIQEYYDLFKNSATAAKSLVPNKLEIEVANGDILYVGKGVHHFSKSTLALDRLSLERSRAFVISETKYKDNVYINGNEIVPSAEVPLETYDKQKEDFFYGYAAALYYHGQRMKALDIIVNNVHDRHLANLMVNAFTVDEVAEAQKNLFAAAYESEANARLKDGRTPPGYLPKKDAFCIMDVFETMFTSENPVYYIPFSNNVEKYNRITRKVEETFNLFKRSDEEVRAPVNEFVWHKDHVNLSLRFKIEGTVQINPNAARNANLPTDFPACIYRNHTFIKDGQLNVREAEFLIPGDLMNLLGEKGVTLDIHQEVVPIGNIDYFRVVIDFESLPLINRSYADSSNNLDELLRDTKEIARLEAAQKVTKYYLDATRETVVDGKKEGIFTNLYSEQIRVLEEHGISRQGVYEGVGNVKKHAEHSDAYETRTISFYLKGAASLPSNEDFIKIKEGKKKPNIPGEMMLSYYQEMENKLAHTIHGSTENLQPTQLREFFSQEEKEIKRKLASLRVKQNRVKLAKLLTHDWFEGLNSNDKGEYAYTVGNDTMILRSKRTVEYV